LPPLPSPRRSLSTATTARAWESLTNVGQTPICAVRAEKALLGKPADEKNIQEASRIASEEAEQCSAKARFLSCSKALRWMHPIRP